MPRGAAAGSSATQFKKGRSGNPAGRPAGTLTADVAALAREHGPLAIQTLVKCLSDPRHKVAAAEALLNRGYGRPQQTITGDSERPLAIDFTWQPAAATVVEQQKPTIDATKNTMLELVWQAADEND